MITDYHCHILPRIDDGAKSVEEALTMIATLQSQGVAKIIATPHFYAHREKSVERFLEKREKAYQSLLAENKACAEILLGAEVAVEHGLSKLSALEKLKLGDSPYMLLELPFQKPEPWIWEEIEEISLACKITPVIAHLHRYAGLYTKADFEKILESGSMIQINIDAFGTFRERKIAKMILKSNAHYLFGSDCHNLSNRKPNFDILQKTKYHKYLNSVENII